MPAASREGQWGRAPLDVQNGPGSTSISVTQDSIRPKLAGFTIAKIASRFARDSNETRSKVTCHVSDDTFIPRSLFFLRGDRDPGTIDAKVCGRLGVQVVPASPPLPRFISCLLDERRPHASKLLENQRDESGLAPLGIQRRPRASFRSISWSCSWAMMPLNTSESAYSLAASASSILWR